MKPNYQLARAAAIYVNAEDETSAEYGQAVEAMRAVRIEDNLPDATLYDLAALALAHYVLSIPDAYEEGKRAGYADAQPVAEPNPMPSLFERFGGPVK